MRYFIIISLVSVVLTSARALALSKEAELIVKKGIFPGISEENETEAYNPSNLILMGTFISGNFKEAEIYLKDEKKLVRVKPEDKVKNFTVKEIKSGIIMLTKQDGKILKIKAFSEEAKEVRRKVAKSSKLREATIPKGKEISSYTEKSKKIKHEKTKTSAKKLTGKAKSKSHKPDRVEKKSPKAFIELLKKLIEQKKHQRGNPPPFPFKLKNK